MIVGVVRGQRRKRPLAQQVLHLHDVGRVDVGLALVGHLGGFLVGALHQPHARAAAHHARQILRRAKQRRLQHDAEVGEAIGPERLEDVEGRVGVRRVLHVDAHEEPVGPGRLQDAPQVVERGLLRHVEPKLRELQRDVAPDAAGDDRDRGSGRSRAVARLGFLERRDAFAEVVERLREAARFQAPRRLDGFLDAFRRR